MALRQLTAFASLSLAVNDGLEAKDVIVECVIGIEDEQKAFQAHSHHTLIPEPDEIDVDGSPKGEIVFSIDLKPNLPGLQFYKLRIYPYPPLFAHRFETGYMRWA